ncbi:MAG: hypothetical protein H6R07_662 [Proteobacteria bacterium]|nr:hypothetical protein [Pseudomonadota bacterium]
MNTMRWIYCLAYTALALAPSFTLAAENTQTNSIGMEFTLIPAGSFLMGSADELTEAAGNEKPRHRVTISKPFYLSKYEVTQAQWEAVMGSNPYSLQRSNSFYSLPGMAARLRKSHNPATVSWLDAQEFIQKLNRKEGHQRYRLPTEAEWEYAARAGTTTAYSFGDDPKELGRYAWHGEDFASGSTHPFGQKAPNPWGLYDMHGNVWEWVQDGYDEHYYANSPAQDPQGPRTSSSRVVRGGSWHESATSWRSAFRRSYAPDYRGISIGFRLVMSAN